MEPSLIESRACGACNVCCVALTIDDPELQKLQGYRCRNAQKDNSCAIYDTRPDTCRTFFCGWRQLKWVRETLRPDISGVLVRRHNEVSTATGAVRAGVMVTLLDRRALKAEGLAETVAAAVAGDIPVFLHIPGPPGRTSATVKINDALAHAVATKDKPAVLDLLRQMRAKGLAGKHEPIRLKPHTPQTARGPG